MKFGLNVKTTSASYGELSTQAKVSSKETNTKTSSTSSTYAVSTKGSSSKTSVSEAANKVVAKSSVSSPSIQQNLVFESVQVKSYGSQIFFNDVKSPNEAFDLAASQGINKSRPDLISITDFLPIYGKNKTQKNVKGKEQPTSLDEFIGSDLTPAGKMLTIQLWARQLIADDTTTLIKTLEGDKVLKKIISDRKKDYFDKFQKTHTDVSFLYQLLFELENIKIALDLKVADSALTKNIRGYLSLKDIFTDELGFSLKNYESFSNTKIFLQLLFDLNNFLSVNSYTLLNGNTNRGKDDNQLIVNQNYPKLEFNVENFSSQGIVPKLALQPSFHKDFVDSLPSDPDDRIKFLVNFISKEYRVSRFLGDKSLTDRQKVLSDFPLIGQTGDPFQFIVGNTANSNSSLAKTPTPISGLARIVIDDGDVVLPFEKAFLEQNKKQKFIPGSAYLVDSVLTGTPLFDTTFLKEYARDFDTRIDSFKKAIEEILQLPSEDNLNEFGSGLGKLAFFSGSVYPYILVSKLFDSFAYLLQRQRESQFIEAYAIFLAIFDAAHKDITLKNLLLEYFIASILVRGDTSSPFYNQIVQEISLDNFSQKVANMNGVSADKILDTIAAKITDRLQFLQGTNKTKAIGNSFAKLAQPSTTSAIGKTKIVKKTYAEMASYISKNTFLYTNGDISPTLIGIGAVLGEVANFTDVLEKYATTKSAKLSDGSGRTRRSLLSVSTVAMMVLEIFTSFCSKYTFAKFEQYNNGFSVKVNMTQSSDMMDIFTNVSKETNQIISSQTSSSVVSSLKTSAASILNKLTKEEQTIQEILNSISRYNEFFQKSVSTIARKISTDPDSSFGRQITEINAIMSNMSGYSPAQIILSKALVEDQAAKMDTRFVDGNDAFYVDDESYLSPSIQNAIFSLFREPQFTIDKANNLRVVSVGVPTGFVSKLNGQFQMSSLKKNSFVSKQQDIVYINVYKINQQYDDIVFKPQKFLFELSRFVPRNQKIVIAEEEKFSDILSKMNTVDYSLINETGMQKFPEANNSLDGSPYSFLTVGQKKELISNHIKSYLLECYVRYMTSFSINEKRFLVNSTILDDKFSNSAFMQNLVETYFSQTSGTVISLDGVVDFSKMDVKKGYSSNVAFTPPVLELNNIPKSVRTKFTEELKTFIRMFSTRNLLSDGNVERKRILMPCLYDRIFHLPVDPDDFEVDIELTNKTQTGKKALQAMKNSGLIVESKSALKLKSLDDQNVVIEKYFITIDTIE